MKLKEILEFNLFQIGGYNINLIDIIEVILILFAARIFICMLSKILRRILSKRQLDSGEQFAIIQLIKYVVYPAALLLALEAIGVRPTILLAGSAALLVGFGLGIQSIFNDLISGVILLMEGSISVDDIVIVDGVVGKVQSISIRTSRVETRDDITIIIPNSKFIGSQVTNWTYNKMPSRFQITVGVAYQSDIDLVNDLMLQIAAAHPRVLQKPASTVFLDDMGESSLNFILHFYSTAFWDIEQIKSELRKRMIQVFREQGVQIPFPQRDLWVRELPG